MKRIVVRLFLPVMLLIVGAVVASSARSAVNDLTAPVAVGSTIDDFTLPDADGKDRSLSSLEGTKGSVLLFVATRCPVSNAYNERMQKLADDYKAKGINVIGINSNVSEPADDVKAHAASNNLTFPILKDPSNKIADRLGASVTPEAYFIDGSNKLLYHGRIDNSRDGSQITSSELRDALDAALAGKPVAKTEAKAFGCSIKRA